ncbi:hypothetical protein OGM63_23375 [Plectonema radiosum NIES-515]|uniref:Uncharacterized protein n=1 Tax=Plectonema radiosum NIES-515 TaxID=2986073 RepID=A0ABT3B4V6_9CYAN|nr:hypothetical protein [Plectonema radiosum]MCV3216418.1 hypothetical protein [Plectonema radiosum NIES-515]
MKKGILTKARVGLHKQNLPARCIRVVEKMPGIRCRVIPVIYLLRDRIQAAIFPTNKCKF